MRTFFSHSLRHFPQKSVQWRSNKLLGTLNQRTIMTQIELMILQCRTFNLWRLILFKLQSKQNYSVEAFMFRVYKVGRRIDMVPSAHYPLPSLRSAEFGMQNVHRFGPVAWVCIPIKILRTKGKPQFLSLKSQELARSFHDWSS